MDNWEKYDPQLNRSWHSIKCVGEHRVEDQIELRGDKIKYGAGNEKKL